MTPTGMLSRSRPRRSIQAFDMLTARYRVVPAYKVYAIWWGRAISPQPRRAIVLKATVILMVLVVSTSIHAQPTSAWSQPGAYQAPRSTWNDSYQPPKSQWSSPKTYRAPKSAWSTNGSRQPAKRQAPQSWWTDPGHQDPPTSAWDR